MLPNYYLPLPLPFPLPFAITIITIITIVPFIPSIVITYHVFAAEPTYCAEDGLFIHKIFLNPCYHGLASDHDDL